MSRNFPDFSHVLVWTYLTSSQQAVYAVRAGSAAQGVDEVNSASTEEWPLLLTPILSGEDGRARMEAVFHVAAQQDVRAPSQAVAAGG